MPVKADTSSVEQEEQVEQPVPVPTRKTEAIYEEIGAAIRDRRELLGLSLDEIEGHTRIPVHYLNRLEEGKFDSFPSPTQARGMLSIFVEFLDMDSSAVLQRYAEALQARLAVQQAEQQQQSRRRPIQERRRSRIPSWLRNLISVDILVFGVLGIFIIVFAIWGVGRVLSTRATIEPQPTAPPLAQALLPSPTSGATATETSLPATDEPPQPVPAGGEAAVEDPAEEELPEQPTAAFTLQPFTGENIQVYLVVRQRSYMRVTVDGEVQFDGRVVPGDNFSYTATQQIELLAGNAAAFQVFFNETDLGPLGIFGEVVDVVYTREGPITPTPTITPTPNPALVTPSPSPTEEP
jgi:cytoskeletal protein RodZ